jgi:hypothetical protein
VIGKFHYQADEVNMVWENANYSNIKAEGQRSDYHSYSFKTKNGETKKGLNSCVIFDDMTAYLKNKETLKLLKKLIFNRRQIRTSIYFLVQTYFSVPKDIRKLFTNCFVFRVNQQEMETIFEEIIEKDKKLVLPVLKFVYNEPYQYHKDYLSLLMKYYFLMIKYI